MRRTGSAGNGSTPLPAAKPPSFASTRSNPSEGSGPAKKRAEPPPAGTRDALRRAATRISGATLLTLCTQLAAAQPAEFPGSREIPPGDPVELEVAGFAKLICSALFVSGRSLRQAIDEDGSFVEPPAARRAAGHARVDRMRHEVSLELPGGVVRTARLVGDQGCVILPRGEEGIHFTPVAVASALPAADTLPWPMGDRLPDEALPADVDATRLARATDLAFEPPEALTAAFVVAHRGRIVAERYGPGTARDTRLLSWSMGKSLTATLLGLLVREGVYDPWQPAPVAEWQGKGDPRGAIRIVDLMRMSGGLRFASRSDPDYDPAQGYADHDYIYTGAIDAFRWAITRPAQWPAGTVGRYRNSDPLVLNALIRRAVEARGENYLRWPQHALFDRLGMRRMLLETDPYGNFVLTGYDLGAARDWLRLGMLYLQDGVWNGERLLPEGWVDLVRTPAPAWEKPEYGAMFWLNRTGAWPVPADAYYMSGAGGQNTIVIPTHELVVVRMGHYKGEAAGEEALKRALAVLVEAVPQARAEWVPPAAGQEK
jgi:CubicO group peptidase (beta-lactamase class C family)